MADKKYDFNKSLKELTITDLKARIDEDQLRLKKTRVRSRHFSFRESNEYSRTS